MRRKIGSMILVVCILLVWMPDTVMAARMERRQETAAAAVQKVSDEEQKETDGDADKSEKTNKTNKTASRAVGTIAEGSGSEADPYRIGDAETLRVFADLVNGVGGSANTGICAVLTGNIDLSGVCGAGIGSWTSIGKKAHPYTGTFDGAGFSVNGLYYSDLGGSYAGLFGYNSGVIKNLGVAGGSVEAGSYTGSVCGYNKGTIAGCYNAASVKGGRYTGGVCGNNEGGSVNVCYNTGEVSGEKYVGGVCGYNKNILTDCYNMGTVSGSSTSVGGVCGYNKKQVANCYNTGAVSGKGTDYVGSICGYNHSESSFLNCYYLTTGTENGNYGIAMTRERFAAGEVCWLLNDGKSEGAVWHQTCGQGFPAFGGKTVYQVQAYRESGGTKNLVSWYTNEKSKSGMQTYTAPAAENTGGDSGENAAENPEEDSGWTADGHVYQKPKWKWKDYDSVEAVFTCQDCGEQTTRKATIKKKTTEATCAAEGKTVYTASVDLNDKTYKDTKTVKIPKAGHQTLTPVAKKAAMCEEAGIKRDCWICPVCKQYFGDQKGTVGLSINDVVEPALGHKYGENGVWTWAADLSRATVVIACGNSGCDEKLSLDGIITSKTTATCKTPGTTTYTATAQYNGKTYTDTPEPVAVEILPHDYSGGPKWEWSEDKSTATAVFSCSYGCGTTVKEKGTVRYETTGATCKVPGTTIYTATVQYEGEEYEDSKTVTDKLIPHDFSGEPKWEWSEDNSTATAVFSCSYGCGTTVEKEGTVRYKTTGATCTVQGTTVYTATLQYNEKTYEDSKTVTDATIPHDFSGKPEWKWSEDKSTATAVFSCEFGCGETMEKEGTVNLETITTEATCKAAGKGTYKAVVENGGKEYTSDPVEGVIPQKNHTLGDPFPAVEAECEQDGSKEYWVCSACGGMFCDAAGSEEIKKEDIVIPAKGHTLVREKDNIYKCTECGKSYSITEENGTRSIQSLEDGTVILQKRKNNDSNDDQIEKNDNIVIKPEEEETQDGEAAPGGTSAESVSEKNEKKEEKEENGKNEEILPAGGDDVSDGQTETPEQAGQEKPAEEVKPAEQIGQEKPAEDAGPAEQMGQEKPAENAELAEPTEQEGQPSAESGAPEENDHYGLIYPEGEEVQADPMVSDAWEEGAVNLRVKSSVNGETQEEQEQIGYSMWISIGVLIAFTGIILLCILRRKEN